MVENHIITSPWDYFGYGWDSTGITLPTRTFQQIPYKVSNGNNASVLENGQIKFKRDGVYLFVTTFGITVSSDNRGYYDLDLFYNNNQNGGIIDCNVRPNRGYIGRYNFTNIMYCKKDDVVDARVYSDYADVCNSVDTQVIRMS